MRLRRAAPILLLAAVFTGGLVGGFGFGGRHEGLAAGFGPKRQPERTPTTADAAAGLRAMPFRASGADLGARGSEPVKLVADEAALVAEIGELQLMAQGTDLALDGAQWSKVAAVTLGVQAIRQNYEAEIARATAVAPGRCRVEIPGYAAAGAALRTKFYAQLGDALGDEVAAHVVDALGARLEGHFGGFGVSLQTLDVAAGHGPEELEITRTVSYWNRAEGGDQLVTRRETHLPAWEDPSGERWSALLAVVARSGTAG